MDLVRDLLAKSNQEDTKRKKRIIEWGDESDEEDEGLVGETTISKDLEVDRDKKVFLDSFKSLNKENMEHIPYYSGILNGDKLLDWLEAINN